MRALTALLCVPALLGSGFTYREALPGYRFEFPRDHFEHRDFRTEWWYYTGNVQTARGDRYGFELVFFRMGARHENQSDSKWAVQDVYLAHAALTDVHKQKFLYDERLNREGPGLAGGSFERRRVWNGNWYAQWSGDKQTLEAITDKFRFHLDLAPEKPVTVQGENGVSQKSQGLGRASHYLSFSRLGANGSVDGVAVKGNAWMDHEWFSEQLGAEQVGWDWFSVQLDNKTELMLFELRKKDGSIDPYSSGTFIDAAGNGHHLSRNEFTLEPLRRWGKYPVEWQITIPSLGLRLNCKAVLDNQELKTKAGPGYWEGAVYYSGSEKGVGYLEMTGYEGAVRI